MPSICCVCARKLKHAVLASNGKVYCLPDRWHAVHAHLPFDPEVFRSRYPDANEDLWRPKA